MIANVRQKEICRLLKEYSAVSTSMLAKRFNVSSETIRKDLLVLEKNAELTRVHGGAVANPSSMPHRNLSKRMESMRAEKLEISNIAASFIENGDEIAIDTGSTAVDFINVLMDKFDTLTIVTHSADVFRLACNHKDFNIILCGGHYLKNENSFYGGLAMDMLDKLHVQKAFIFPAALSLNSGICDTSPHLSQMQKKIIQSADKVFVIADSSKYEKSALIKVSDMSSGYTYISDPKLSDEIKAIYKNNEINIITKG